MTVDPADHRNRAEKRAARAENSVGLYDGCLQVIDVLQRLREDEAVEAARRDSVGGGEIADDCCVRVAGSMSRTSLRSTAAPKRTV